MTPRFSVITVCRNSAATLERALLSVSKQDWPSVEHIVIDGASTDGTAAILNRFKSNLTHVLSEPDQGIYDAMNKGLQLASGDWFCFLNADDQYASSRVLTSVADVVRANKFDAVFGDVAFFDANDLTRMVRRYRSDRFTPERLAYGWMPAHPALFLAKSVIQRVGFFKPTYRIAGDFDYIARAFYGHNLRYAHMPEVLVHMQTGGASTAGWHSKVLLNQEVLHSCRENGIPTNLFKILSKYPMKFLELFAR